MLAHALFAVSMLTPAQPRPAPAKVNAVINRVIATYGGPRAISKLKAYRMQGVISAHVRGKEGRTQRDFVAPGKLRVRIAYPQRQELRLLDGAHAWRGQPSKLNEARGFARQAMDAQLLRATPAWLLSVQRAHITLAGGQEHGGVQYTILAYQAGAGLSMHYWVDKKDARIRRVEAIISGGGMQLVFVTEYSDFRKVQGVLVPFVEQNIVRGKHAGTTRVERVRFGHVKSLGPFSPPANSAPAPKGAAKGKSI